MRTPTPHASPLFQPLMFFAGGKLPMYVMSDSFLLTLWEDSLAARFFAASAAFRPDDRPDRVF